MEAAAVADNWETISLESFRRTLPPSGKGGHRICTRNPGIVKLGGGGV